MFNLIAVKPATQVRQLLNTCIWFWTFRSRMPKLVAVEPATQVRFLFLE
jgi:hypothetical protein